MVDTPAGDDGTRGLVKSPLDFAGGLFLVGIGVLGFGGAFSLPFGHLSGIGSGLMPKSVAVLIIAFGALLLAQSVFVHGDRLEAWAIRGPLFVLSGVVLFALTVRPWGLIVAGPLAVVVSALADRDTKPMELVVAAVGLTLVSGLMFKELLGLAIPFDPGGLVPEPLVHAYVGAKSGIVQVFAALKAMISR
jgi:putative tricarboxylic transport membrane protein